MNIATTLRYVKLPEDNAWNERYYIMNDYMLMAKKYGIGLYAVMTRSGIEEICKSCDGLIIPGSGTNIDPKYYNGAPLDTPPEVDEYDLDSALIKYFYEAGKPIFGVCGGEQAINVFFGGTIARVPFDNHYDKETFTHEINVTRDSFVYDVFGRERCTVNCYHGYYASKVAPDFKVVASTDDGIVEAIEWRAKNIYATQWHPEQSFHTGDPIEHKFFENFLMRCEERRLG